MLTKSIMIRAFKISFIVGSILNIINQGDNLLLLDFENINITKFILTYAVPYLVTTYTAISLKLEFSIGTKSSIDTNLKCKGCGVKIHVNKNDMIPECPKCGLKTHWKLSA